MEEMIALKFAVLQNELNERQCRLWVASEAMCLGHGGVSLVSRATGLSRTTLHLGIRELESGDTLAEHRVRRESGGRKKVKDTQPTPVAVTFTPKAAFGQAACIHSSTAICLTPQGRRPVSIPRHRIMA